MFDLTTLSTILTVGINSAIIVTVLLSDYRRSINIRFVLWLLSVVVWDLTLYVFYRTSEESLLLLIGRINFAVAIFIVLFAINFISMFPDRKDLINRSILYLINIVGLVLVALTLLTSFISVSEKYVGNQIETTYGDGYIFYVVFIVLGFLISTVVLINKYLKTEDYEKDLVKYFGIALVFAITWGLITNVFLPLIGIFNFQPIGPLGTIIFSIYVAYAILKYQFLDVRVLIGKITYYSLMGGIFFLTYYGIYYFDRLLFGTSTSTAAAISGIFNAMVFAVFFVKFNDYLRTQVRSRIINPGYDPLEVLDRLSRQVAQMLEIDQIANEAMTVLNQTIRADYEAIYVSTSDDNKKEFLVEYEHRAKNLDKEMLNKVFKIWSSSSRSPIVYQELEYEMPTKFLGTPDLVKEVYEYMKSENLRVILPLRDTDENAGMLILGQKEADSSYSVQDIEFIQGVATTVGLAVTRAFYYEEVQDLNRNLQKRVEEATEELQGKNARLEKALKKIEDIRQQERDMIDVMGHELRTPITIVRNALLVLQSKLKSRKRVDTNTIAEYVEKAVESARREINLVETLLSATKVESNRIQLTLTKIDMLDVVNDSIEGHKSFAKDKKIKIDYKKPRKKIYGFADRTRIQEVMDNFLSNAIKYTMRGKVEISVETDKEYSSISITDTGIGISKDDLKHLGKKFFRAKQYLKNDDGETNDVVRPGGTGLGLYVSFNLVRLMNGEVEVESEIGEGSTFTLKVPKYKGQEDKHIDQTFEEPI